MHLLRHRKIPREHDAYLEEMKMKFAKRMDRFGEGIFSRHTLWQPGSFRHAKE